MTKAHVIVPSIKVFGVNDNTDLLDESLFLSDKEKSVVLQDAVKKSLC